MRVQTKETQSTLTPQKSLELLINGNKRFQENLKINRNLLEQANSTASGQYPFAAILSCIDSRTSAELIFDQGLGDVFSIRIAGNILNDDIIGSMEFACKVAGSKLIVVMGHSACGAVKGACNDTQLGHLTGLLSKIKPAVELVKNEQDLLEEDLVQRVAEKNVDLVMAEIIERSPLIASMVEEGQVGVVGVMYSVQSGAVSIHENSLGISGGFSHLVGSADGAMHG